MLGYVSVSTLAQLLDVSETTVWDLTRKGHIPKPVRYGGSTRWRWSDVEAHIEGRQGAPAVDDDPILRASRGS
ncbi:hypothetical protein AN189_07475 [Loktanella sp. 3ANDIMAR09]|nr:hypothetical protein AN189_07475 [Loktanella sp. 3ANDIMAR09]